MKKLLFPTDFSDTANNAFVYALHFAKAAESEIFVLHVFEKPVFSSLYEGRPELVEDVYTNIQLTEFDRFKEEVARMHKVAKEYAMQDVSMKFLFEEGELQHVIRNIVRKEHIDMITMGTNGASGFSKKFWGTNTVNTIQAMEVPILSVPQAAKFHHIHTIGITTMFKHEDKIVLGEMLKEAEFYNGQVKCLHVLEYGGNMDTKIRDAKRHIKEWKDYFNSDRLEFVVVESDSVKKTVIEFTNREHIDILVIVKRKISFFESIFYPSLTDNLAKMINIPLLVVKEPEKSKQKLPDATSRP